VPRLSARLVRCPKRRENGPVMVAGHDIGGGGAQHLMLTGAVRVSRAAVVSGITSDSWLAPGVARFRDPAVGRGDDAGRYSGRASRLVVKALGRPASETEITEYLDPAGAAGAALVDKQTLFREADVVTVHLVLSRRTRDLIGTPEFALMKPTARFVNTSRGPIVNEAALIEALRAGRIAGAAVDVFDVEPLSPDHPFRKLDNVLATPHLGYVTEELYRTFYSDAAAHITAWLEANVATA
jgi:pimeloyl-ACP methyl ester carboxylesterase